MKIIISLTITALAILSGCTGGNGSGGNFHPPLVECKDNNSLTSGGQCILNIIDCPASDLAEVNATAGFKKLTGSNYGTCQASACLPGFSLSNGSCNPVIPSIGIYINHGASFGNYSSSFILSQDLGLNYEQLTLPNLPKSQNIQSVTVSGSKVLEYLGGEEFAFQLSTDGGRTYSKLKSPYSDILSLFNLDMGENELLFFANHGASWSESKFGLVVSFDSGATYNEITLPLVTGNPQKALISGENILIFYNTPAQPIFMLSKDKGKTFAQVNNPVSDVLAVTDFSISGDKIAILSQHGAAWSSAAQNLSISTDSGQNYYSVSLPIKEGSQYAQSVKISGEHVLLEMSGSSSTTMFLSGDLGLSFNSLNLPFNDILNIMGISLN